MLTPKILIVDDEIEHLEVIVDIIEESGNPYRVLQAFSGDSALRVTEKEIPDLIITDWEMPEMSGIELIRKLKNNDRTKDIPIIMCTGVMTSSENLETALQAGAADYIRKPIDDIELIARTRANLYLANSYAKIKKLSETKDRFFSIISHDLKGPVGNIKAHLELIHTQQTNYNKKELLECLTMMVKQSGAAYTILENLLLWANSNRGDVNFEPKKHRIDLAIESNIDLLENSADNKNIVISNETNGDLLAVYDLPLISTVIRNLIANAIKFTPKNGKITVNVEQNELETLISVTDNGMGISPDQIEKLFDETSFESTYGTNNEKGSGLGIKLCKYFVEQHKGRIWVESEVEKGSKFIFSIPREV